MKVTIDRIISPRGADLAFSPTDSKGTPGILNQYILNQLNIERLPTRGAYATGAVQVKEPNSIPIRYIVTVGDEASAALLQRNLSTAVRLSPKDFESKRVWIPLL
jgi:hypothetical protein